MKVEMLFISCFACFYQNAYAQKFSAKKIVVFLIPPYKRVNGGVMSIFNLSATTRELFPDMAVVLSTPPGWLTLANNKLFPNKENIYRWAQIRKIAEGAEEMILHIPEYMVPMFLKTLSEKDRYFLQTVSTLRVNILNQNIDCMPSPEFIRPIFSLTKNVSQTTAHDRYASQEVCNKWGIITHHFSAMYKVPAIPEVLFNNKKKRIVYSPDSNPYKEKILAVLRRNLPDYTFVKVQNISYIQYLNLISSSLFTITFGEGFDGYFLEPCYFNSVGFAVYNSRFFPNEAWKDLKNVFLDYEDMALHLLPVIRELENNGQLYKNVYETQRSKALELYSLRKYEDNIKRFYLEEYDYYPIEQQKR